MEKVAYSERSEPSTTTTETLQESADVSSVLCATSKKGALPFTGGGVHGVSRLAAETRLGVGIGVERERKADGVGVVAAHRTC